MLGGGFPAGAGVCESGRRAGEGSILSAGEKPDQGGQDREHNHGTGCRTRHAGRLP